MRKRIKKQYRYSRAMEITTWEYHGLKNISHGMTCAYSNPDFFKKECLKLGKKIRKRINQIITNDEFLRELISDDLDQLDKTIKLITKEDNEIDIIASLFKIIAHLLGWAHLEGKFFRTPIYYQTEDQKERSLRFVTKQGVPSEIAFRRRNIILQLRKENLSYQQIGLILGISDSCAKQLEKANHLDKWHDKELKRKNS